MIAEERGCHRFILIGLFGGLKLSKFHGRARDLDKETLHFRDQQTSSQLVTQPNSMPFAS